MKIQGRTSLPTSPKEIPIVRGSGDGVVFTARAVNTDDLERFNQLCPAPKPLATRHKDGTTSFDVTNPEYLAALDEHSKRRMEYIILSSLDKTEDLQWDTVDMSKPETWANFNKELIDTGLSLTEINDIVTGIVEVNNLDQEKVEAAKKSFLAARQASKT
jgi:hypothetical protein